MRPGMIRRFTPPSSPPVGAGFSAAVLALSPSLYWPFDAIDGVTDQSGNNRNGTGQGSISIGGHTATFPPLTGEPQSCTDFISASTQRVTSTYSPFTAATARTFLIWANQDVAASGSLFASQGTGTPFNLAVNASGNVLFTPQLGQPNTTWSAVFTAGAWQMVTLVFDEGADQASLYMNGSLSSTQSQTAAYSAPGDYQVGAREGGVAPFDGKMGHAAVFESGLNGTQISDLYAARLG